MLRQSNNVLGSLPQRSYAKLRLAETMKKVLAKTARRDGGIEILIGAGDDAVQELTQRPPSKAASRFLVRSEATS